MSISRLWMNLLWMGMAANAAATRPADSEPEIAVRAALQSGDAAFALFNNMLLCQ